MKTMKKPNTIHPRSTHKSMLDVRNFQILEMREHGFTLMQIAEYFGLSYSGVRQVLGKFKPRGIGEDDNGGFKKTLEMTFDASPDLDPIVEPIAVEVNRNKFFSNRLTGGKN